ncbi:MAG: hypothetical protein ACKOXM_02995 [Agromyces sp.]
MTLVSPRNPNTATAAIQHGALSAKPVTSSLWRVTGRDDRVLGHVRIVDSKFGERYAATLILPGGIRTMFLGEFWSLDDALDCFA